MLAELAGGQTSQGLDTLKRRPLVTAVVVAAGYYAAVQAGLAFTFESSAISILWPPNAILLAALLLTPAAHWWLLIAAVFPAHLAAQLPLGVPANMALGWFVSNVTEALIGAALIRHLLKSTPQFDRVRHCAVFLAIGVVFAPLVSSFIDVGFVALAKWRYTGDYWAAWRMRLFSNALAALTIVPPIVIWMQRGVAPLRRVTLAEWLEGGALLIGICATSVLLFQHSHRLGTTAVMLCVLLPFLMWAAVRGGVSGISLCTAIVAMIAVTGVVHGQGPFADAGRETAALEVQLFLIIVESSLMLLAASLAELRATRAMALHQEESLNLALDAAQIGTWDWDIAQDRVTWRRSADRPDDPPTWTGSMTSMLERIHPADRATFRNAIDDALRRGGGCETECRYIRGNGEARWITLRGKVLVDARDHPGRMIGVYVDTTQRKSDELQALLQHKQLAHLSRVALLAELSGALAHELNQPLATILANARAAQRELQASAPNLEEVGEMLSDIVSDDKRAAEIIRRLRALFVHGTVEMEIIDVNQSIGEVLELERNDLIAHGITVEVSLAAGAPIRADRIQIQQVLLNLVSNARDAMAAVDSRERRLRIQSVCRGDGSVEIEICDNGQGIDQIERIFDPFYSTKSSGIGLGLTICRTIVTGHLGRLWATNNAAGGATFHIWIPPARSFLRDSAQASHHAALRAPGFPG